MNFLKGIYFVLLYYSNISTTLFVFPIISFYFDYTESDFYWYYFGFIIGFYEFGKFFGYMIWRLLIKRIQKIILLVISLSFLVCLNGLSAFLKTINNLLMIRFLLGLTNNLGIISKTLYTELGLKENILIRLIISILFSSISLILPSLIELNKRETIKYYHINCILLSTINFITILLSLVLVKKGYIIEKKVNNFIKINKKVEKFDYNNRALHQNELKKPNENDNLKKKNNNRVINSKTIGNKLNSIGEKSSQRMKGNNVSNITDPESLRGMYKYEKGNIIDENQQKNLPINENGITNHLQDIKKSDNDKLEKNDASNEQKEIIRELEKEEKKDVKITDEIHKENEITNTLQDNMEEHKEIKLCTLYLLCEINVSLISIWTLIIFYIESKGKSIEIAIYFSLIRGFSEIILYPINSIIIRKFSNIPQKKIRNLSFSLKIMILCYLILTLGFGIILYVYYHIKHNKKIYFLVLLMILFNNVFTNVIIQIYKLYTAKELTLYSNGIKKLKKLEQFLGSLIKTIFIYLGSYSYVLINLSDLYRNKVGLKYKAIKFIFLFIIIPAMVNLSLLISSFLFF